MQLEQKDEPIFNIPLSVVLFSLLFIGLHLTQYIPSGKADLNSYLSGLSAFNPLYFSHISEYAKFPLGLFSLATTVFYSFFHADFTHLFLNTAMFVAFGAAISERYNLSKFMVFCLVLSISGAIAHAIGNWGVNAPVIGASAITSGLFAACLRLPSFGAGEFATAEPLPLRYIFTSKTHLLNIMIWLGTNYLFGSGMVDITGEGMKIAWQAHVGGFVAGFFMISLFKTNNHE